MKFFKIIYSFLIKVRNLLFEYKLLKIETFKPVVISVGNVLSGGTGKTPVVDFLVHLFKKSGLRVSVISRGYKGHFRGVREVDFRNLKNGAYIFGDEPMLLALKHKEVPIFVGKNKRKALRALCKKYPVDLVIADDAFQHRFLGRDVDIVVMDALAKFSEYNMLPQGRAREPLTSLKRAHFILLNRVNLISLKERKKLIPWIRKYFLYDSKRSRRKLIIETKTFIDSVRALSNNREISQWRGKKVFLSSGIGRPSSFFKMIQDKGFVILGHRVFKDHHSYNLGDVRSLIHEGKKLGADFILITEKDAVKFLSFPPQHISFFYVARMSLKMSDEVLKLKNEVLKKVKLKNNFEKNKNEPKHFH